MCGQTAAVVSLLARDTSFDVQAPSALGASAVFIASQHGHAEVVRVLLDAKADSTELFTNGDDKRVGWSPLFVAAGATVAVGWVTALIVVGVGFIVGAGWAVGLMARFTG